MLEIIIIIAMIAVDLVSKTLSVNFLTQLPNNTFTLIDGVFELTYVQNTGMAFGMLKNGMWLFIVMTVLLTALIIMFLLKERRNMTVLMRISISLVLAGALGNFIDRVTLGYVRDMFSFVLINFAIFNVADSCITVGAVLFLCEVLFTKHGRELVKKLDAKKTKKDDKDCDDEVKNITDKGESDNEKDDMTGARS